MFDQSLPFKLVQVRKRRPRITETYDREYIFKFYRHNKKACIKYIVIIKAYYGELLTLDFYPKINLTPKLFSLDTVFDLRYRILTKQFSFGQIGAKILDIMGYTQQVTGLHTWGFQAASLPNETTNFNNKRYKVYKEILRRTYLKEHEVFADVARSAIFVIPTNKVFDIKRIIGNYEKILSETN